MSTETLETLSLPEELLRKLLSHFYKTGDSLEWSHNEGVTLDELFDAETCKNFMEYYEH